VALDTADISLDPAAGGDPMWVPIQAPSPPAELVILPYGLATLLTFPPPLDDVTVPSLAKRWLVAGVPGSPLPVGDIEYCWRPPARGPRGASPTNGATLIG